VLNEATLYGLPMYGLGPAGSNTPQPPPAPPTTQTDPLTGLEVSTFDFHPTLAGDPEVPGRPALRRGTGARGNWYTVNGLTQVTHLRPIQPRFELDITHGTASRTAHGALVTSLASQDETGFNASFSRPTIDLSAKEPELEFGDAAFPSKIQSLTSEATADGRRQRLVLVAGQFFTDGSGTPGGVQRLFTRIQGQVLYSTSTDFEQPLLQEVTGVIVGGHAAFALDATDRLAGADDVVRVLVLFRDATGAWRSVDLARVPGTARWTGGAPATGTRLEYFVQAVDQAGNVAVSTYKARYYEALPAPPLPDGVTVTLDGTRGTGGWFLGPVDVTVADGQGRPIETSVDGGASATHNPPQQVTGNGLHSVTFHVAGGPSGLAVVPIDLTDPNVTIDVPGEGEILNLNSIVRARYSCTDAGSGIASCAGTVPDGGLIDTSVAGPKVFTVTATDAAGRTRTVTRNYRVAWPFTLRPPLELPPAINLVKAPPEHTKIHFSLGGFRGDHTAVLVAGYPQSREFNCNGPSPVFDTGEATESGRTNGIILDYNAASDEYIYQWKPPKSYRGTCRQFILKLKDGSTHRINFKFRN
jgi:hypothetical protein